MTPLQHLVSNPRRLGWLIQTIVWMVLYFSPFLFRGSGSEPVSLNEYLPFFISMTAALVVFYVNYCYLGSVNK